MRKTRKILCMIAAISLIITMMSGCGGKNGNSADKNTNADANSSTQEQTTKAEKAVYNLVTVRWTDAWPVDFLETGFMASLEKQNNVDINWKTYYYSDWSEQKSLLLASGDLPDAFFGSICLTDTDVAQNLSSFIPLDDMITKNMPNLTKIMAEDPSMKALVTSCDDGKIYSLPKRLPLRPKVADIMYINKKWLDNLGLQVPKTYLELQNVLQAFKDKDADGDGDAKNEYPYSNRASALDDLRHLMSPFGTIVSRQNNYMGMIDGKPVFMPTTENFKNGTKWIHELYKKGLIDPERFTQDDSMVSSKAQAEGGSKVGIVYGWTADAQVGANAADFIPVEAVAGPDGQRYAESDPTFLDTSRNELLITKKCKNPDQLLKWADAFYTDEASLQTFYGSIPDQISKNSDDTYTVLNPADGGSLDTSAWSNSFRDFGPKYMSKDFQSKVKLPADNGDGVKLAQDELNEAYIHDNFPRVGYTTQQSLDIASLSTDIYKYVETTYAHWIVDGGVEEEWDNYIKQLETMGLPKLVKIQTDAYNSYIESLK